MIIQAITKSSAKVVDKYNIYFWDGTCLSLSSNPDSQQGFSQYGESFSINDSHFEEAAEDKNHRIHGSDEILINWFELPVVIQAHIEKRIMQAGK